VNTDTVAEHKDGGFHYVRINRRTGTYPIGYCRDHAPHASREEARACYSHFRRDNLRLDVKLGDWAGCTAPACDKPTKKAATVRYDSFSMAPLCDEHLTMECASTALGLDEPAGDSWHS
jgi:hypothetical protein